MLPNANHINLAITCQMPMLINCTIFLSTLLSIQLTRRSLRLATAGDLLAQGQNKTKFAALADGAFHTDFATQFFDNPPNNR